jgi:putative ABC transport system substrate-binding protein
VQAQQPVPPVVGLLRTEPAEAFIAAFRRALSEAGYTDGTNVTLDIRVAEGKRDRLSELAADLVRKRVAVIVANTNAIPYAISATRSIPIVFVTGLDPVAGGFVPNLNHPGGNVTGVSFFTRTLGAKRLEILHELVPKAETVALLFDPDFSSAEAELRELDMGGRALGQKVVVFKASNDREIDAAFTAIAQAKVSALLVGAGEFLTSRHRQIIGLAAVHKIPAIYVQRLHTEAGGLMSYGASATDAHRRAGVYVARILKGEKPGDLPVELPTKFELVINLKTAKALGLDIPFHLQQRADELIE